MGEEMGEEMGMIGMMGMVVDGAMDEKLAEVELELELLMLAHEGPEVTSGAVTSV